jgi:hypothetical protein
MRFFVLATNLAYRQAGYTNATNELNINDSPSVNIVGQRFTQMNRLFRSKVALRACGETGIGLKYIV